MMKSIVGTLTRVQPGCTNFITFTDYYSGSKQELLKRIDKSACFIFEGGREVIGLVEGIVKEDQLVIPEVIIRERFRLKGHGDAMLTQVEKWSSENGIKKILVAPPAATFELYWTKRGGIKLENGHYQIYPKVKA